MLRVVEKGFNPQLAAHNISHPKELVRIARENPREAGIAAAAATAGGAAAGQGAYYAAGFGAIHRAEQLKHKGQKEGYKGLSRSQQEAIWRKHRKEHGHSQSQPMTVHQQRAIFQNYPKQLPGAKHQRFAAHIQRGKYGPAILASTTGAGAVMAGTASARGRKHEPVAKALYIKDQRPSILRTAEMGLGLGLAAWGIGRSGMIGRALARGVKFSRGRNDASAVQVLQLAQAAQGTLRAGTAPAERHLRQIRTINRALNSVPGPIRGDVATAAGVLLASNAHPIRREGYRPIGITGHVGFS